MLMRCLLPLALLLSSPAVIAASPAPTESLAIGDTFTLESKVLGEIRRINVFRAPGHDGTAATALPVLYMPDGGIGEDFLHVAGLLQVSVGNGTMRPFMLVGIENTERRRDMTGPTTDPEDFKIAPRVGGSAAFRSFLRDELMPSIKARYPTTGETAIIGESAAGLFVVETLILEPELFDSYLAFDPSLWWNRAGLLTQAEHAFAAKSKLRKTLYLAHSNQAEIATLTARLARQLKATPGLRLHYQPMPEEQHHTIYHPAALKALRTLFAPVPVPASVASP